MTGGTREARPPVVLMVAPFLAGRDGRWSYAQDLSLRLAGDRFTVRRSSTVFFRPLRMADMVGSALGCRGSFEVALIDVYSGPALIWAEAVSRTLRIRRKPYALALHGGALPRHAESEPQRMAALLRPAAAVVAPSRYLLDAFSPWRPDIRLIPNAIDLADYPGRRRRAPRPRLMWLRSFHRLYNPAMAIRVLAQVLERHGDASLTMAGMDRGDGSFQECRALARELGVLEKVIFTGAVPKREVGRVLSQGDIFLNTTNIDNAPVSMIEAMACGLCIVSTEAGGVPYLVRDGLEALLVKPGDTDGMTARVLELLDDQERARALSESAARKASEFGWETILPQWIDLLSELAGRDRQKLAC